MVSATPAEGNLISGNALVGVYITDSGTTDNVVAGNLIGTNAAGTAALGNGGVAGIRITPGAQRNRIGTNGDGLSDDLERNVISGNAGNGVQIDGAGTSQNVVAGNFIGTDVAGTVAIPNDVDGVLIQPRGPEQPRRHQWRWSGRAPLSGTSSRATCRIVSRIQNSGTDQNIVAGNFIGTTAAGNAPLPNGGEGVQINGGRTTERHRHQWRWSLGWRRRERDFREHRQ